MAVQVTADGLDLGKRTVPLTLGSVQYWRLPPEAWPVVLDRAVELGLSGIETYLPWSVHEREPDRCDFSGRLDLGRFLDLAAERALVVMARPGPHINAELTGFGYPARVLSDQTLWARGPDGAPVWVPAPPRMFPALSLATPALDEAFAGYLDALAPVLRPRLHPGGPVVALQADNETAFFFRTAAFDQDYSPASLAAWRDFLRRRYEGELAALNRAHRSRWATFAAVEPPRRFAARALGDLPPYLDWLAFKEELLLRSVGRIAALFERAGLTGVAYSHNLPMTDPRSPLDPAGLQRTVDLVGVDLYHRRTGYRRLRSACQALAATSRLPWAAEFGCGHPLAWTPLDLDDQVFCALAAVMHGLRGFNLYMLVERERWTGAAVRSDGALEPERADCVRRLLRLLERCRPLRRRADCALLVTRLSARLQLLANPLEPLSPLALDALGWSAAARCQALELTGCSAPPAIGLARLEEGLEAALERARLAFDRTADPTGNHRLALLPTFEMLPRAEARQLQEWVRAGGVLAYGPQQPMNDELGAPAELLPPTPRGRLTHYGDGALLWLPDLAARLGAAGDLATLLQALGDLAGCRPLPDPQQPALDVAWHEGTGRSVLWLANPSSLACSTALRLPGVRRLHDLWRQRELVGPERFDLTLPPWSIAPLEVER